MAELLRTVTLDAARVAEWSAFTGDANPLHTDAIFAARTRFGAPIVQGHFIASLALDAVHECIGRDAVGPVSTRFRAPVPVDATIEIHWDASARLVTVVQQHDAPVLVELSVGSPTPGLRVTRAVVDEYAAAARDRNPIHMDDAVARASGFDGAIAHGMLTLGWAATQLLERSGSDWIRSLRARFSAPVPVGDRVWLQVDSRDDGSLEFTVLRADGTVVIAGQAITASGAPAAIDELPLNAEPVQHYSARVGSADAARFARAIGSTDVMVDAEASDGARATLAPTLLFAAGQLGFDPDEPANAAVPVPDAVRDSQRWAETAQPVVHAEQAFAFARALHADETLRATTAIVGRRQRDRDDGSRLRFTQVRTVFHDGAGEPAATSEMNLVAIDPPGADAQQKEEA